MVMYSSFMKSTDIVNVFYKNIYIVTNILIKLTINMVIINSVYEIPGYEEMHSVPKSNLII